MDYDYRDSQRESQTQREWDEQEWLGEEEPKMKETNDSDDEREKVTDY